MSQRLRPPATLRPPGGRNVTGLGVAAVGVGLAALIHYLFPMAPVPTLAVVLGVIAAHLPGLREFIRTSARPGLSIASKQVMRLAIVLLGLQLSVSDVMRLGWATAAMVLTVVVVTFLGTLWLGRRIGLPGDQPLLVATGYSICGASAIGAVSRVAGSREEDIADAVAVVTLCGTLAIAVLPLLQHPLGLDEEAFGRWVGASVHDVGQVVAAAQTAGAAALSAAVLVKLMRVVLLVPLVALVAAHRRARGGHPESAGPDVRPPLIPLFVAGFLVMIMVRSTGQVPPAILEFANAAQGLLLASALFGLGAMINVSSLTRTGTRMAGLGLASWVTIAAASYAGVLLTT